MAIPFTTPQPPTSVEFVERDRRPTLSWAQYLPQLHALAQKLAAGQTGTLVNAANDAAAAAAGVQIGQQYRSGSQLMVRVS